MVDKIFDFPSGSVPFVFSSDDPQVKSEVAELRSKHVGHRNKMPIYKIEEVMLSDETEDGFIRSFTFYFISTILCPTSYCFGNTKFLYSLRDVSVIPSLDFGQLALNFMHEESEGHFEMIMSRPTIEEMNKPSHIGECLPIWGNIYLDFVDFDVIENHQSTVDYSLPRISLIKNDDFYILRWSVGIMSLGKLLEFYQHETYLKDPMPLLGLSTMLLLILPSLFQFLMWRSFMSPMFLKISLRTRQLIQRVHQSIQKVHLPCFVDKQWMVITTNLKSGMFFDIMNPGASGKDKFTSIISTVCYNFKSLFALTYLNCTAFSIKDFDYMFLAVHRTHFRYDTCVFILQILKTYRGMGVLGFSTVDLQALREIFLYEIATYNNTEVKLPVARTFLQNHSFGSFK